MPTKNETIKESIKATRERHAGMRCRVFEVKIDSSKLSKAKKAALDLLFREAKWLRNSELAKGDPALFDRNAKEATVKVGDAFEVRSLTILGSQIRQDVVDALKSEIKGLSTKKAKGEKVGRLKFKAFCNSIPLRQYGTTYRIDFANKTISVQKLDKQPFKVRGLKQIPDDAEFANAKLIRKPNGYYFHITTYTQPLPGAETGTCCGIDFGIGNNLTLDDGTTVNIQVPESKAVKLASKRVNKAHVRSGRQKKKSKNHKKRVSKLQAAYEKQNNVKHDAANKVVANLLTKFDFIAIQDEMIAGWHRGLFGKQVQHSAMGIIKAKLMTNSHVHVVERSFPSTQICPQCGKLTKHPLAVRSYHCDHCGYSHQSRDAKAALSILSRAIETVSTERRTKSPVETKTSTAGVVIGTRSKSPSAKQEAQVL